jgi:hypothetical protein
LNLYAHYDAHILLEGGSAVDFGDLEYITDQRYYSDERDQSTDPDGPYLIAFALIELVKEVRVLRAELAQNRQQDAQESDHGLSSKVGSDMDRS